MKVFAAVVAAATASVSAMEMDAESNIRLFKSHTFRREVIHKRAMEMDDSHAMSMLQAKHPEVHDHVKTLLQSDPPKLEKAVATKAIGTLNDLYMDAEEQLDKLMFNCERARENALESLGKVGKELELLESEADELNAEEKGAEDNAASLGETMNGLEEEMSNLDDLYKEELKKDEEELAVLEANRDAMQLILEVSQCVKPKTMMLLDTKEAKSSMLTCKQQDALGKMQMVNVFANPNVQEKVEKLLRAEQREKLQQIITAATKKTSDDAEDEVGDGDDDAESFVQVSAAKQSPAQQSEFAKCDASEPDCALMTSKVGGMWGEEEDKVNEKQGEMKVKKEAYDKERQALTNALEGKRTDKQNNEATLPKIGARKKINSSSEKSAGERKRTEQKALDKMWGKCLDDVKKIMFDGVCSIKNVRGNVLKVAQKALGIKDLDEQEQQNCKVTEWEPAGPCTEACVNRQTRPPANEWERIMDRHQQPWERKIDVAPKDTDSIALPCPTTLKSFFRCNEFLCPIDCKLSAFSAPGECSAQCGGGTKSKSRSISQQPYHGGKMCDSLTLIEKCGDAACDVPCKLRARPRSSDYGPCTRGCTDPTDTVQPRKYGVRPVVKKAKGRGKCPKWNKRILKKRCRRRNRKRCVFDEVCVEKMDVVFVVEGEKALTEAGFESFKGLTENLIKKMRPEWREREAVRVAAVEYGNGALEKQKVNGNEITVVSKAKVLSNFKMMEKNVFKQQLANLKKAKTFPGFSNMAQGLSSAATLLESHGRNGSVRKIVLITHNEPVLNYQTLQVAQEIKDKGVVIDAIVVNAEYSRDNAKWSMFQKLPSHPWKAHLHPVKGQQELSMKPVLLAARFLPRICPDSRSIKRELKKAKRRGFIKIHKGRDCGNWWQPVGRGKFRTVRGCARAAKKRGYTQFVFQRHKLLRTRRRRYYCWTDKTQGKKPAFKAPFVADDASCTCTNMYCTGRVKGKTGWNNQRVFSGGYSGYSHYGVINDVNKFIKEWGESVKKVFPVTPINGGPSLLQSKVPTFEAVKEEFVSAAQQESELGDEDEDGPLSSSEISEVIAEMKKRSGN